MDPGPARAEERLDEDFALFRNPVSLWKTHLSSPAESLVSVNLSNSGSYISMAMWPGAAPLENMGRMSGLPQLQALEDLLSTESKWTGFSVQPLVMALGSSSSPARRATWPGLDSVGTAVCEIPWTPATL